MMFGVMFVVEIVSIYLAANSRSNIWVLHLYTPVEYTLLALVFAGWIRSPAVRLFLLLSVPLFWLTCLVGNIVSQDPESLDRVAISIESVLLVTASGYLLLNIQLRNTGHLFKTPGFWVSAAVLVYFAGNVMSFTSELVATVWYLPAAINIAANLLYTEGFLCRPHSQLQY